MLMRPGRPSFLYGCKEILKAVVRRLGRALGALLDVTFALLVAAGIGLLVGGALYALAFAIAGCATIPHVPDRPDATDASSVCLDTSIVTIERCNTQTTEPDHTHYPCVSCQPQPIVGCVDPEHFAFCVGSQGCFDPHCK